MAAVAAQVSETARGARGLAIAVLGAVFLLRGVGDSAGASGPTWLTWLSPVGWAELARPFAGDRAGGCSRCWPLDGGRRWPGWPTRWPRTATRAPG